LKEEREKKEMEIFPCRRKNKSRFLLQQKQPSIDKMRKAEDRKEERSQNSSEFCMMKSQTKKQSDFGK